MLLSRMADSTDVNALPGNLPGYAGYVDGSYITFPQLVGRFYPHAHCVSITVDGTRAAFIDCEKGNLTPDECVTWLARELSVSDQPATITGGLWRHGIYFPASYKREVDRCIARLMPDIPRARYRKWMARWTGTIPTTLPIDIDALQCIGGLQLPYDLSLVAGDFYESWHPQTGLVAGEDDVYNVLAGDE
jgi:hypothetical protein